MFERAIAGVEVLLKGMVFDCYTRGQCVLRHAGLICLMSCPKGLRNSPSGGTLRGEYERSRDERCGWARIHHRVGQGSLAPPDLLLPPDARLYHTSSYLNFLTGAVTTAPRRPKPAFATTLTQSPP